MGEEVIEVLIEGGKATAGPPIGPALGPLKINIGQVVSEINKITSSFAGMQVPVKIIVNTETKEFRIEVGTPPASELLKKEAGIQKGAGNPLTEKVADVSLDTIIKVAKMKEQSLTGKTLKERVKQIIGTANSMGIYVEGKRGKDIIKEINEGKYDDKLKE